MAQHAHFDSKYQLKSALRGLIFNRDPMLYKNLVEGTQILHSEQFPTQVFQLKGKKYIRVNSGDIDNLEEEELDDLLKMLLSIEDYSTRESDPDVTPPTMEDVITEACDNYAAYTAEDLKESSLIDTDAYGNITNVDRIPIQPKVFSGNSDEEGEDDSSKDDDLTKSTTSMAKSTGMLPDPGVKGSGKASKEVVIPDLQEVEQALEEVRTSKTKVPFGARESILTASEISKLNGLTKKLLKAFKGYKSKQKRITPRKHLNTKALSTDNDAIYVDHNAPNGKHIEFNLLIDMSGSMGGEPIKHAVSMIYLFNKLAQQGYVTGSVLYSSTSQHYVVPMPARDAEILRISRVTGSEGLAETVDANVEILKNMNCICITDGDIVDRPIDKAFWRKHKVVSTGVYINEGIENPLEYSGKLDKWFDHSLVRGNLEDMIQLLIRIGIRGKK